MTSRPTPLGSKTLTITKSARADIDEALVYLVQMGGIDVALRFAERIDDELHRLADIGHGGANRDWLAPGLRLTVLGRYSIYFRLTATETIVLRFLHGHRDLSGIDFDDPESS